MKDKISKFFNVLKRDGFKETMKKTFKYIGANYYNKINIAKRVSYKIHRKKIMEEVDKVLSGKYRRLLVWRGSFGWDVPLFQRPQQIANCLSSDDTLILYEVTRMTDKTKFFEKAKKNLYLVNYEIKAFENELFEKLKEVTRPKYLQLYSTCWDVRKEEVDMYVNNGFKLLYEYIDDLNPVLAGTEKLPQNVADIHEYVINNPKNALVVTSADNLYEDMLKKRKSDKNLILSSNGVDLNHFKKTRRTRIFELERIKKEYKMIVGYYGALASWFDYKLVKKLAKENEDIAFVLIGIKYDTSFDKSKIEKIPNIHYLGPVDYKLLPQFAKYFDIAWIPFVINEITLATNPIKLFEYMALKKLIVTSPMPECKKYEGVFICEKEEDYNKVFKDYEKLYTTKYQQMVEKLAEKNSWEYKAKDIVKLLKKNE